MATQAQWKCPQEHAEWIEWLSAGLHGRSRWRLPLIMLGMLFAAGRRTVTSWLRAAGISTGYAAYYYFIASLGRKTEAVADRLFSRMLPQIAADDPRVLLVLDDTPTKRYGPKVQGAGIHHNPTPGPTDQKFLYGHIWVTLSCVVRHALWGTIGLPLLALLYIRQKDLPSLPSSVPWEFRTKLELGGALVRWAAPHVRAAQKQLWVCVDGFYCKRPFFEEAKAAGAVVVTRLRKDARLYDMPPPPRAGQRGRPRKYGKNRISLRRRAAHPQGWQTGTFVLYGKEVTKTYKVFQATYRPADGPILVVLVKEADGWVAFACTDLNATVGQVLETFADRAAVEQDFHDVKEVWGTGQQQVRNIWANIGAYHLNLWSHTLTELWAWDRPKREICDRSASPWDDAERRPSHADRRKALRGSCLDQEFSTLREEHSIPRKIHRFIKRLWKLVA